MVLGLDTQVKLEMHVSALLGPLSLHYQLNRCFLQLAANGKGPELIEGERALLPGSVNPFLEVMHMSGAAF